MVNSPNRYCWDSCVWIARIANEKIVEDGIDRVTRCNTVLELAKNKRIEITCSTLCLAEVYKNRGVRNQSVDKISAFFEQDFILLIALGREIGEKARDLMMSGHARLKPADACHIATALLTPGIEALHTFDQDVRDLSNQFNKVDGTPLKICFPDAGGPVPPLLGGGKP